MGIYYALKVKPDWSNDRAVGVDITLARREGTRLFFPLSEVIERDGKHFISKWILEQKIKELTVRGRSRADIDPGFLEVFNFKDSIGEAEERAPAPGVYCHHILEFFDEAAKHLKHPKVKFFRADGTQIVFRRAGAKSKVPGGIYIDNGGKWGDEYRVYFGSISRSGSLQLTRDCSDGVREAILALDKDPAEFAGNYGRATGACCFCSKTLTDERSTGVGYGPICAGHFGLPWGQREVRNSISQ